MRSLLLALTLSLAAVAGSQAQTKLNDGDQLTMAVSGAPREYTQEYDLNYTVDDGTVNVPNLGRIKAVGLTATQLSTLVEKRLKEEKIFTNPTVVINLVGSPRFITVGGSVRGPGRVQWTPNMTLTMALASAGGPAEFAEDKVYIVRGGQREIFSRKELRKDPSKDPKVLQNDYIELTGEF